VPVATWPKRHDRRDATENCHESADVDDYVGGWRQGHNRSGKAENDPSLDIKGIKVAKLRCALLLHDFSYGLK
jgi:hypothetical protein